MYWYLVKKHEEVDLRHFKYSKASIKYSNDMKDVQNSVEDFSSGKVQKLLTMFDDMIVHMICNKKLPQQSENYLLAVGN